MRTFVIAIASVALGWPAAALADGAILHEYLPGVDPEEVSEALQSQGTKGRTGARSRGGDESDDPVSDSDLGHVGKPRSPAPSSDNFRPDRQTSLEGGLDYYEAFSPSIAPFKRVTAFDAIRLDIDGKTPVLGTLDARQHRVAIESPDAPPPDTRPRDRFTGEIDIDFHAGSLQPLPSISPESRIFGVSTNPPISVEVERDGADNFFVRAVGPSPETKVHVRWETDAPRAYFGTEIASTPLEKLPAIVRPERTILRRAWRFAGDLGISPTSDLRAALEKLTSHFRNFVESADPPADTGDLFLDLVQGGKGLCRHRAYGFVVTARALGIDARFVQNEAHSWVEVRVPETGFLRIDLGGATHGLTAHDTLARRSYVPAEPDSLPRPAAYRQSRARASSERGARSSDEQAALTSAEGRWLPESANSQSPAAPSGAQHEANPERRGRQQPVHLTLDDRQVSALRGSKVVLTGRALDEAQHGVAGLRVEVWILHKAQGQRMLLSVQVSDQSGLFRANFGVPPELGVGDYRLLVRSEADSTHLAAVAD